MTNFRASLAKFLFGETPARKAVTGPGVVSMTYDPPLSMYGDSPQRRMAAYLRAFRVGWFYKAESRIAADIAGLDWHVSAGDDDADEEQESLPVPDLRTPLAELSPIDQFMRLLERPNPYQTGRQLREKAQIRLDMAGTTFLYLEGGAGGGLPTAIYGISPARMTESRGRDGQRIGWVMDRDAPSGGVPFDVDEIICIAYGSEDDSPYGVGVVEAVQAQVPLSELMSRHVADVLTTGGRLAGMLSPKDRSLDEAEYQDVVRAWRNVASDPHAARRLLVFPEPMEWQSGSAKPEEIGIPELATLSRDEILSAFPVSPYMLGVPMPGGLNSGELRKQERRDYWEGTIHPRVELWEEAIKVDLLSRYEAVTGETYDFDFEEPQLDDAAGIVEKAGAVKALQALGFDVEAAIEAVGLDHIRWTGVPEPEPVVAAEPVGPAMLVNDTSRGDNANITQTVAKADRSSVLEPITAAAKAELARYLADQRSRVIERLRRTFPQAKAARRDYVKSDPEWWDAEAEAAELRSILRGLYFETTRGGMQVVSDKMDRLVPKSLVNRVIADVEQYGTDRIPGILQTTRDAVKEALTEGVRRGYSITQIVEGVPDEAYKGIAGLPEFDEYRAEMIARTETALSYNRATLSGYGEFGVERVVAIDGDYDKPCQDRNGMEFTVDAAAGEIDHPNGTLDWAPVIDKSYHAPSPAPSPVVQNFYMGQDGIKSLDTLTPIVNVDVAPAEVNLDEVVDAIKALAADVERLKAPAPVVNVPPPIVNLDSVRVVSMPERVHNLTRDATGRPTGSVEVDA